MCNNLAEFYVLAPDPNRPVHHCRERELSLRWVNACVQTEARLEDCPISTTSPLKRRTAALHHQ